jgi:predicted DNA-binding transcriptional regulator YafY
MVPVHGQAALSLAVTDEIEVTIPFEEEAWAVEALLSLGSAVEVLAPPALRQRMAAELRATAARYAAVTVDS